MNIVKKPKNTRKHYLTAWLLAICREHSRKHGQNLNSRTCQQSLPSKRLKAFKLTPKQEASGSIMNPEGHCPLTQCFTTNQTLYRQLMGNLFRRQSVGPMRFMWRRSNNSKRLPTLAKLLSQFQHASHDVFGCCLQTQRNASAKASKGHFRRYCMWLHSDLFSQIRHKNYTKQINIPRVHKRHWKMCVCVHYVVWITRSLQTSW